MRSVWMVAALVLVACGAPEDGAGSESDLLGALAQDATGGIAEGTAEAKAVLRVANEATADQLKGQARLDPRAADGVVAYRLGDDGQVGTADDETFDTLAELDAVPFVGPTEFQSLLAYAQSLGYLAPKGVETLSSSPNKAIRDNATVTDALEVSGSGKSGSVRVTVDIRHTYVGDLTVQLKHGGVVATLHQRQGGAADDLRRTYAVDAFADVDRSGAWTLQVSDHATRDEGVLVSWSLELPKHQLPAATSPFDPVSCSGPALTADQALATFAAGSWYRRLGPYTLQARTRTCGKYTGCGPWSATAAPFEYPRSYPKEGTAFLTVADDGVVRVTLITHQCRPNASGYGMTCGAAGERPDEAIPTSFYGAFGAACEPVGKPELSCSQYTYVSGMHWGGSGGTYPSKGILYLEGLEPAALSGNITSSCLRFTSALPAPKDAASYTEEQVGLVMRF